MQSNLTIEIKKFEARLKMFTEAEQKLFQSINNCISKLKQIENFAAKLKGKDKPETLEEFFTLRQETLDAIQKALEDMGKAEHEKSHILESFGAIINTLEKQLQRINKTEKPK
ncbi:MAG: hypothetical protein QXD34_03110 [Candidatus Bathyarchaeia archaeon]